MYTIKHLYKEFHLSRSTLLYYDSIGLLKPSERSESDTVYTQTRIEIDLIPRQI